VGTSDAVKRLGALSRRFGSEAARAKAALLEELGESPRLGATELRALHDLLCFMRAWPDDRRVLDAVKRLAARLRDWAALLPEGRATARLADTGLPGGVQSYPYSYPTAQALHRMVPDCIEVDWAELEESLRLQESLVLVLTNGECQGLDDIGISTREWIERIKVDDSLSALGFLLSLFEGSGLEPEQQAFLYESGEIPLRYELAQAGTGRCELAWPRERIRYQKTPISQELVPVADALRRPFRHPGPLTAAKGRALVDLAILALCSRNLEIRSLMHADAHDVHLLDCGQGLTVALTGVVPSYRDAHEATYFGLILKNGVPIAYGPASVCLGCCEMGLNLFPEFRGAEIRSIYAQYMRALHQTLGARSFYLTSYGMGDGNPEAIRTGAFWFYRKLGFSADEPEIEALARAEEERMRAEPGHRSDRAMLKRLSFTDASFDLSGGECARLELGTLGQEQSRYLAREHAGDRHAAERSCARQAARFLVAGSLADWTAAERRALRILGPTLCMIPDLAAWSAADKKAMLRIVRAKGGRTEALSDRLAQEHARYREALHLLASGDRPS
jgi:hypothetical protein